jgi:DNA-binding MarR family transcriptional regulator
MKNQLDEVILFLLEQTSKVARQYSQREFDVAKLDITVDQWVLLKIIEESTELSQTELAARSGKDPASITRMLDILEHKKRITRDAVEGNRRQYNITLTKAGQDFITQNMKMVEEHRAKSTKGFTKQELETLKEMLSRIQKNMA